MKRPHLIIFLSSYMLASLKHSMLLLFGLLRLFQEDELQLLGSCEFPPSAYWRSLIHMPELHVVLLSSSQSQQVFHPSALVTLSRKLSPHFGPFSLCCTHLGHSLPHWASFQCCRRPVLPTVFEEGLSRSQVTLRVSFLSAGSGHDISENLLPAVPHQFSDHFVTGMLPCILFRLHDLWCVSSWTQRF